MQELRCALVVTKAELDHALAVRWMVFHLTRFVYGVIPREVDAWDTLATTQHWVVYDGSKPVATVRLVAPPTDPGAELPFEGVFRLSDSEVSVDPTVAPLTSFAQPGRLCVDPEYRHSRALQMLLAAMLEESLARGVTHWLSAMNCCTDDLAQAELVQQVALARGLASHRFRAFPRRAAVGPAHPRHRVYSPQQEKTPPGALHRLPLPGPVRLCARKFLGRCMGAPAMDEAFGTHVLPMISDLAEVQASSPSAARPPGSPPAYRPGSLAPPRRG